MAKLLENTYRHVNIALVNEMAIFCHELGIDLWDAIARRGDQAVRLPGVLPGPGRRRALHPDRPQLPVLQGASALGYPFRFVELAQEINAADAGATSPSGRRTCSTSDGQAVKGSSVLLLGVTYKPNIADQRESPARPVARRLRRMGAQLAFHDPYVEHWEVDGEPVPRVDSLVDGLQTADLSLLLQDHAAYDQETLRTARLLFDTRGVSDGTAEVL